MDDIDAERSKALAESIHTITVYELQALGDNLFPYVDHPWREKFLNFLSENSGATFHHATTDDNIHIIYCHDKNKGIWFMPGSGVGPLQSKGLAILKKIVEEL